MRVMYFCCCCSCVAAAAVLLFAAAVRHRVPDDAILLLWFIATDSVSVFSLFIPIIFIFNAPLGSAVARTASIYLYSCNTYQYHCMHPRQLRACAEPRRAAARRDKSPLECFYRYT